MRIQVTFPFPQAIYQRITKISRFLTPPKYKNQPVLDTVRIQESASLLASHDNGTQKHVGTEAAISQAFRSGPLLWHRAGRCKHPPSFAPSARTGASCSELLSLPQSPSSPLPAAHLLIPPGPRRTLRDSSRTPPRHLPAWRPNRHRPLSRNRCRLPHRG